MYAFDFILWAGFIVACIGVLLVIAWYCTVKINEDCPRD